MPVKPLLKIGLIGVGRMGSNHLRVLSSLKSVQVVFIHDIDPDLTSRLAAAHGTRPAEDLDRDLALVDAVIIASPTHTHLEYISRCLRFTPCMFVEKPLTDSLRTTRDVARMARERGLKIQVGFIERFNPAVAELAKIVPPRSPVVNADFTRTDRVPDRSLDVDVVLDVMVHDLDLALHLRGPVVQVQAFGHSRDGLTALAQALLVHADGTISRIMASKISERRTRRIALTCPDMVVEADLLRKELAVHRRTVDQRLPGATTAAVREAVFVPQQEALQAQLAAFAAYCRGGDDPALSAMPPTADTALACMELAEKVRESIARNAASGIKTRGE